MLMVFTINKQSTNYHSKNVFIIKLNLKLNVLRRE